MACGNGKVSRDYLSSAPADPATLFIRAHLGQPAARAAQDPRVVVRLPRAPRSERWGDRKDPDGKDGHMYYSHAQARDKPDQELKAGVTDYFIGPDGNPTIDPNRHIHVIHDEKSQEVKLILTDRTQQSKREHWLEVTLPGNPSGNQVNKAIDAMVATLNQIPRGPKSVQWP